MSAYVRALNREMEQTAAVSSVPKLDLRQRFVDWHGGLPDVAKQRPFAMAEIGQAMGTQGKYLSPIMLRLGWSRHRRWTADGPYSRYWLPPAATRSSLNC